MKLTSESPALSDSDALATIITSLFVDTSVETRPPKGPSEINLEVIRLKLHSIFFGLRDHF